MVGIDEYPGKKLDHAVDDAHAIKTLLEEKGACVWYNENCTIYDLWHLIYSFLYSLRKDDVALVYFAGHAVEANHILRLEALPRRGQKHKRDYFLSLERLRLRCAKHIRDLC